jgi:hypothetical protein
VFFFVRTQGERVEKREKGCTWKKAAAGCLKRTDGRKQHGYFGLIVRDIPGYAVNETTADSVGPKVRSGPEISGRKS